MGHYTLEQIAKMDNPYKALGTSDDLAAHATEFSQLNKSEMIDLAKRMVEFCPQEKINEFSKQKEALREGSSKVFYDVLSQALEIGQCPTALLNQKEPYRLLSGEQFKADLYNTFDGLFASVCSGHETAISIRLAETTPEHLNSEVLRNLEVINPALNQSTQKSFNLRHAVQTQLLGTEPVQFFKSREFSIGICHQFMPLICHLIKGQENIISDQLAKASPDELKEILPLLEKLNPDAAASINPFRLILLNLNATMAPRSPLLSEKSSSDNVEKPQASASSMGLFSSQPALRKKQHVTFAPEENGFRDAIDDIRNDINPTPDRPACNPCTII